MDESSFNIKKQNKKNPTTSCRTPPPKQSVRLICIQTYLFRLDSPGYQNSELKVHPAIQRLLCKVNGTIATSQICQNVMRKNFLGL